MFQREENPLTNQIDLESTIHEILHVVGFSKNCLFFQIDHIIKKIFKNTYIQKLQKIKTYRNIITALLTSKNVVEVTKKYYICKTVESMQIENYFGNGTLGAHWERTIIYNEIMTAAQVSVNRVFFIFTIACSFEYEGLGVPEFDVYADGQQGKSKVINQTLQKASGQLICPLDYNRFCNYTPLCPNYCYSNGVCVNGQCICKTGYGGIDFSIQCSGVVFNSNCLEQSQYSVGCLNKMILVHVINVILVKDIDQVQIKNVFCVSKIAPNVILKMQQSDYFVTEINSKFTVLVVQKDVQILVFYLILVKM
ncbi:leishmanolysin family protein, putative [Ichthyophthirius multifiliis]|uniref:Leishmanolysin family protein, putative n=1 Tax=Ichthyophthirius multifiliis TaxID=5932 RepID=G0QQV0_ICHMU|nr:leishmanolysin family protein, putative [Ichthyophthirius multifiliis]EGR32405.1 leishmanolysin family protein, putative [Ichthyophthirius multifiliis]|eukprot:XP_004036391.1 leishmanolysin family protein, putative [Ichthyophthirius multifiliis]